MTDAGNTFLSIGVPGHTGPYDAIIIGASFGGPTAIEHILKQMPRKFPTPVMICQHIAAGFTSSWADRLNKHSKLRVAEASAGTVIKPGHAYIAPAGLQTRFTRVGTSFYLRVDEDFADSLHVPSIDMMMSSAAHAFGNKVLAILLTGLGDDGAAGMLAIRQAGGYTIAESEETAASHSMPLAAANRGAVIEQLPLDRIVERMLELTMSEGAA